MKILGIDPGFDRMGYSFLEMKNSTYSLVSSGLITTDRKSLHQERLLQVYKDLSELISKFKPIAIATETLIFSKNIKTASKISEVRGIIQLLTAMNNLKYVEFSPLQVKSAITGYGRASKKQIEKSIKLILKLSDIDYIDDVIDAIAISICGLNKLQYVQKLEVKLYAKTE